MNSIEDILDGFGEKANTSDLELMEQQETFDEGLQVLKSYAESRLGIDGDAFDEIKEQTLRTWYGPKQTKDDLWVMLLWAKDSRGGPIQSGTLNIPEEQKEIRKTYEIRGFGKIKPGTGEVANVPSKSAYFFCGSKTYKARVNGGKVSFVRYGTIKKIASSFSQFGVAGFSVEFNLQFDQEPPNFVLSTLCHKGSVDVIDWVISLMHSRDIKISSNSDNSCYVPSSLVNSDDEGMCLSQSIGKHYFQSAKNSEGRKTFKKFLFDERTGELFWVPCQGMTLMKVIVKERYLTNSFELVDASTKRDSSRLKNCRVSDLSKHFGGRAPSRSGHS